MDISAVDGNRTNEDSKPVDREKVHSIEFVLKPQDTVDHRGTQPTKSRVG